MSLTADRDQITRFVAAIFRHADPAGYVSLRAFTHETDKPVGMFKRGGEWLFPCERVDGNLIERATAGATYAANYRNAAVFAPPCSTFTNDRHARAEDLANGLVLSVDCDQRPVAARAELEALLGPATIVVASGSKWKNPETRVDEPKVHLHWRLAEPTRTPEQHRMLKAARVRVNTMVRGDKSADDMVHPLRWAGSWNTKPGQEAKLAEIVAVTDNEITLNTLGFLLDGVEEAPEGVEPGELSKVKRSDEHWQQLAKGVTKGTTGRHTALASIMGYLLMLDVQPHLAVALVRAYNANLCTPSVSDKKVDGIIREIARRQLEKSR